MNNHQVLERRYLLRSIGAFAGLITLSGCYPHAMHRLLCHEPYLGPLRMIDESLPETADAALRRLLQGNQRYAEGRPLPLHVSINRRLEVASAQKPFATIFGCVDSRVPPEIIFDAGLGDLFVIRTAGHVIDDAVLGSLEFGVAELGIPLLLVLGHESCGAVTAAVHAVEDDTEAEGNTAMLVDSIRPAVDQAKQQKGDLLDNAIRANVEMTVQTLTSSPYLADAVKDGSLTVLGAYYDLETGLVEVIVS